MSVSYAYGDIFASVGSTGNPPYPAPQQLLHTDGFPLLAEGVRQLYCFRRESETPPYYTIRASTLVMQINDAAASDDARSRFTAWDPWQYMMMRPARMGALTTTPADVGNMIGAAGALYDDTVTAAEIAEDLIDTAISYADITAPAAAQTLFLRNYVDDGCSTTFPLNSLGWAYKVEQGTSLGQALQDLCATGYIDIVLTPIYEASAPGALCDMDILSQATANSSCDGLGAGVYNYNAIFAWDMPGRNVTGVDDLFDGLGRANRVQFYNGQGGPAVAIQDDATSIATYGEYWAQQWFPARQDDPSPVIAMAEQQLWLRKNYKQTLTINPAPTRAPEPFVDYGLGDRVPVYASDRVRQSLGPYTTAGVNALNSATVNVASTAQFPDPTIGAASFVLNGKDVTYTGKTATSFTGCGSHDATVSGDLVGVRAWQRIYGVPVEIDDSGTETVRELLVGIVGAP